MSAPPLEDRVRGVLFGHAIGDSLGLGAEFLSREEVTAYYPTGLRDHHQIVRDGHRRRWAPGEWTDDTAQMLCIADSLLARGAVDLRDIVRRFINWARDDGRGLGRTTGLVISHEDFWEDPAGAARAVWELLGKTAAPNGALMRTSVLGVWHCFDEREVIENATRVCLLTHADPRCVASCVAYCAALSVMLRDGASPEQALARAAGAVRDGGEEFDRVMERAAGGDLAELALGAPEGIGYTYKCLSAAFWALLHAESFEDGIVRVINEGGDADTNGCAAGALLGARFGYSGIPRRWVEGLRDSAALEARVPGLVRATTSRA